MRPPGQRGWADSLVGFVRRVFIGAYEDNILFLASALTFDALLAALPFVLLLLAVFGFVLSAEQEAVPDLLRLLHQLLPSAGGPGDPLDRVEALITGIIESRAELSIYGLPLFLWFSTRFFSGTRSALNEVFDTTESRRWVMGKLLDLGLVLVTLVLVVANTTLTVLVADLPWFGRFVATLSTFGFGVLLFFLVYNFAPSRRVRWDTALIAAAVAALGFEIAKMLFGLYLANFATLDRLISNANAIAVLLFVLWLYYTMTLFLLGAEIAETYDLRRRQREQRAVLA